MSTNWNGKAVAELIGELVASARERPGLSTDTHVVVGLDRAAWERAEMAASVVQREREQVERAQAAAPPPAPPHEREDEEKHDGATATVTTMTASRRRRREGKR